MIVRHNIPIYDICWLNHAKGGMIGTFYEPESRVELLDLCRILYLEGKRFDIIGHTSNIYFLPSYSVEIMVSTRRVNSFITEDNTIIADCGVSVRLLSRQMIEKGVKGFEGLVDLPGTVAASVYGNASCYGCSINELLLSVEFLQPNGEIVVLKKEDLKLTTRSSSLKRKEINGIILSVTLRKEHGKQDKLRALANLNHQIRETTQPDGKDNLGSIYKGEHKLTLYGFIIENTSRLLACILSFWRGKDEMRRMKRDILFKLLNATDIETYVHSCNRYIWKDEKAHFLFWKYHRIHQRLYKPLEFEIEIKG